MIEIFIYFCAITFLLFVLLYSFISQGKRKFKDIYAFQLPGWSLLKDMNKLYEIELLFQQGLVGKVMKQTNHSITDFHSNLKKEGLEMYSGFIRMERYQTAVTTSFDADGFIDYNYGWTNKNVQADRYFWAKLSKEYKDFIHSNTMKLAVLPSVLLPIEDELRELEAMFGFNNWDLILHSKDVVILVNEIFYEQEMRKFIDISERITQKLELTAI